ncbi:MAG: Clp protease N-terminal domain-containing protein [Streptosporangiaceae bacterium]
MFERFSQDAKNAVVDAQKHARRLGHNYIGGEHIMLAVVSVSSPASAILSAHGLTPEYVEAEITRRLGPGAGAGADLFGSLDRDALAAIGIDLDTVRARIEASFGPQALARADFELQRGVRLEPGPAGSLRSRLNPRRALPPRLTRRRHPGANRCGNRRLPAVRPPRPSRPADAPGRDRAAGPPRDGHIPFTPVAKRILELTLREMLERRESVIGVQHIALALTVVKRGMVPYILAGSDTSAPTLHAEIVDQYRQAS